MKRVSKLLCTGWVCLLGGVGHPSDAAQNGSKDVGRAEVTLVSPTNTFTNNTITTNFGGGFSVEHEIADDVRFSGTHTVAGFSMLYHADVAVNATFKFYRVNQSTGRVGTLVATFTANNLPAGDRVFDMALSAAQQFSWPAAANLYNGGATATGGFFSVRFTPVAGGPLGSSGSWAKAGGTSSGDGFVDVTDNQFISFQGYDTASFYLQVKEPGIPGAPALSALRALPPGVMGGASTVGIATLGNTSPDGGTSVTLQSSDPQVVGVPASVIVPAGATSVTFPITTTSVPEVLSSFVSAFASVTRTANITVGPFVPPDTISITQAVWRRNTKRLQVTASSTNDTAQLTVSVTSTGVTIGSMTNVGGNSYVGNFTWPSSPAQITVRSNYAGSAAANVTTTN